jgi:Terminase large subunit, T4likevirus-type, N-terminal
VVSLAGDLRLALDRVTFASSLGLDPDPWQERLLRSTSPRVLLNCSRQSGKSTMSGIIALHRALYFPGSLVLCLAPSERQSKELFAKVSDSYRRLRGTPAPASDRKLGMRLPNGSRIEALPGSEKTVRGFSGTSLLIVDEASRVEDELYYAITPMLAVSGGSLMMLTTPYGKRGVFHQEWTGGRGWERYEVPASRCPRISEEFIEEQRETLPPWVLRQEYECSFEETEDQVFSLDMIERAVTSDVKPLFAAG